MALKSTIFKARLQVADIDHGYYADHAVTLARHPSETDERLMVRLAALALQAHQVQSLLGGGGIGGAWRFGRGLSDPDEPDLMLADDTGRPRVWVEVGQPDERPLAKACSRADRVVLYAYAAQAEVWWRGLEPRVARLPHLEVWRLPATATTALAALAGRSVTWQATLQEGLLSLSGEAGHVDLEPERWR
jgi:uncharacterized protein YaeQ